MKVVLITGTSSGIGLEVAAQAAATGWRTVATMRDPGADGPLRQAVLASGASSLLEVRQLDVTDDASVDACVAGVVADHGRIDAVVNNAGRGHVGTMELDSLEDVRQVMEVNFFGAVRVAKAAFVHLRAAQDGRLVSVSSVGGAVGNPFNEAYCAAKFALEGYMEALAPVAASVGVKVSVIEPGAVSSEFVSNLGLDPASLTSRAGVYAPAMTAYVKSVMARFGRAQSPREAAAAVVETLTLPEPPLRLQTSDDAEELVATKLADLNGAKVMGMTRSWIS
ncbi:SDR family oxidoreductase [Nonomuraea sp. NBC_01738]|uniref:SDR family oxidoreductase n=1 Tax=Nonomuraea sp. NBC_01738 TaxID=2976003 RepID=UPI002E10106F|nr:SDR family oxidoreductase [Nonomuraea sp. NBC_01738]